MLLLIIAAVYTRLLLTVSFRPGFIEKEADTERGEENEPGKPKGYPSLETPPPGLEKFYKYDVFVSEGTGRPIWCQNCKHWKPDRTRHCSELDKCVSKMDHYCPWVGGVVAENSFKWFIQFTGYSALMAIFLLVVFAYYTAERSKYDNQIVVHWIVFIAVPAFLGLFTFVMCCSSSWLAMQNSTSVEHLAGKKSLTIAVRIPPHIEKELDNGQPRSYKTVTYPLTPMTNPDDPSSTPAPSPDARTFAVLHTKPGDNLWDLGYLQNWRSVMGNHVWEWFLPVTRSPAVLYQGTESAYQLGPLIDEMKREAGLLPGNGTSEKRHRRRSKSGEKSGSTDNPNLQS
ncbi:MAG: palmitoyltransferase pfa5 [Vezdaea aestivalis]|nr:MAG: palmitoyltransferase pfa5 [Vezdaea aestivalis]